MPGVPVLVQYYSAALGHMGHEHLLIQNQTYAELCALMEQVLGSQSPNLMTHNWAARTCQEVHVRWGNRQQYGWPETTVVTDGNWWVVVAHLTYGDNTDQLEAFVEGM
jgi:hypothetical protein